MDADKAQVIFRVSPACTAAPVEGITRLITLVLLAAMLALFATVSNAETKVVLTPTFDAEIDTILAENLTLPLLLDNPELAGQDLSLQIEAETRRLVDLLRAQGYLNARVEVTGRWSDSEPIIFTPVLGDLFRIGWIRVFGLDSVAPELAASIESLMDAKVGENVTIVILNAIRDGVLSALRGASFGHSSVPFPEIHVDPTTSTAGVTLTAQPGAPLTFGGTYFDGSYRLDSEEAAALVPYRAGEPYTPEAIDALRTALETTNRFRRVRIELDEEPNPAGQTDVYVDLRDRAPEVAALARSSGIGPKLLMLSMLMVVLMECLRVTSLWTRTALRRIVTLSSIGMIGACVPVVVMRIAGFLN